MLKCPGNRKESWRTQMRHRFNQYSCCPSFEKSYKSMTEIPSGNTGFLPRLFSLSSFLLPPCPNNGKFAPEWVTALCHAVRCQPLHRGCLFSCLLVNGKLLSSSWARLSPCCGTSMAPNIIPQCCNMTLKKWADFDFEQGLEDRGRA